MRERRRRRFKRNVKRAVYAMLIAPAGWPRLTAETLRTVMRIAEICGIFFVASLFICMVHHFAFIRFISIISGILFAASVLLIQLQRYQDDLEECGYQIQGRAF
ncbi:MAG: hypothetical protein K6F34_01590 [Lachnospiraceae bacterium]|nr:hypothetical protein [Lachnospiraceae bacterium]